ncbi:hypothetical protein IW146_010711, partial [Coemansia sp. RSA 922]
MNARNVVKCCQQHSLDDIEIMASCGNPVVVFHMDTTTTSIDTFIAYMSSVFREMKVFNFYVWYDSSQINIPEYTVHNDTAQGMGATFFNYGRRWG